MSNARRICVCGRERGKEPVLITITTCRHKHPPTGEGSFCISSGPVASSTPTNIKDEKNKSSRPEGNSKKEKDTSIRKENTYVTVTEIKTNQASYQAAQEILSTASPNVDAANESMMAEDTTRTSVNEVAQEAETTEEQESGVAETPQLNETEVNDIGSTENETLSDTLTGGDLVKSDNTDTAEPTVMMVTETAVNTMPFLENLFKSNNATKSMPSLFDEQEKRDSCALELLIFQKHAKSCRDYQMNFKNDNIFFDEDSVFETMGRITFPTCTDTATPAKSEPLVSSLNESGINQYARILKMLERYIRNKQFHETFNDAVPIDLKLKKYITLGKDPDHGKYPEDNVEELYLRKNTTDRSVQFKEEYVSKLRRPKWYDGFLMCFGLKNTEDANDMESKNNDVIIPKNESSYLITKYLRI